jgi:hypothetical protein
MDRTMKMWRAKQVEYPPVGAQVAFARAAKGWEERASGRWPWARPRWEHSPSAPWQSESSPSRSILPLLTMDL